MYITYSLVKNTVDPMVIVTAVMILSILLFKSYRNDTLSVKHGFLFGTATAILTVSFTLDYSGSRDVLMVGCTIISVASFYIYQACHWIVDAYI